MDKLQYAMLQYRTRIISTKHALNEFDLTQHKQEPIPDSASSNAISLGAAASRTASGQTMIALFAEAAAAQLSPTELSRMTQFFSNEVSEGDPADYQSRLMSELERLKDEEIQITGESQDRLAQTSGSMQSALGIILHCQSKDGKIGEFWDEANPTIQTLARKGFKRENIFGYDWHWRAEGNARKRTSNCPATAWSVLKRSLHNQMSHKILDMLPIPFVIVAGACPRKNYQTRSRSTSRQIAVTVSESIKIEFELDFQQGLLSRVAVFVAHPATGFFRPDTSNAAMIGLDSALNLFMYMLAIDHIEDSYTTNLTSSRGGIPGCAPFAKMHEYHRLEKQLGRPLEPQELEPAFLSWALRYLKQNMPDTAEQRESLSHTLHHVWKKSLTKTFDDPARKHKHNNHNRTNNARRYGWDFKEYWHGQKVKIHSNRLVRLHISPDQKALRFSVSKQAQTICMEAQDSPAIFFDDEGLCLKVGAVIVFRKTRSELLHLVHFGANGLKQLDKELQLLAVMDHQS